MICMNKNSAPKERYFLIETNLILVGFVAAAYHAKT